MSANVIGKLTPGRRPRGRAVIALLPGVFALMLAGASGVAAAPSPNPSPTATAAPTVQACSFGTKPGKKPGTTKCCPSWKPCMTPPSSPSATPTSTATPAPSPTGGTKGITGAGGSTPTPTPAPTTSFTPTPKPVASSGGSSGSYAGGRSASVATGVTHPEIPIDPTPFAPLSTTVNAVTSGQSLDAARIPPVEALTPLSGLEFGNGLNLGPILLLIDLIGIGTLFYLVRTRWLAHEG
jgi:hypothetical protein